MARLLLQIEDLEGRYGEFDEFLGELAQKREEVTDSIAAKRQTLLDERQRLLSVIANPSVALILMMIGIYGLFIEFTSPGGSPNGQVIVRGQGLQGVAIETQALAHGDRAVDFECAGTAIVHAQLDPVGQHLLHLLARERRLGDAHGLGERAGEVLDA